MLGLFSKSPKHPLADDRESKRIFAELAKRDPRSAIEEASGWFESLNTADELKLERRLTIVFQLDETVAPHARRLGRDYLAAVAVNRSLEQKLWEVDYDYWQQLIDSYLNCLSRYQNGEKDAAAIRPQLPLLYGRLIKALSTKLKWDQFRYGPLKGEFWSLLGGVYLAAVEAKCAQKERVLYPGAPDTSIEAEYLKALIFQASSMSNLSPMGMELSERFIEYFLPFFNLTSEVRPDNLYWVDASKPIPPTRLAKLPDVSPMLRFFNGTKAVEAVEKTIEQIRTEGRVPPKINLGAVYEPEVAIRVLAHLGLYWGPKPPMRSNPRHRMSSEIRVVNGLAEARKRILEWTDRDVSDLSDLGNLGDLRADIWTVEDVSLGGMSARAQINHKDWIHIGALIGMQPDGGDNWLLGIVRRYGRGEGNQGAVGIETLSKTPRAVTADGGGLMTECILLDAPVVGEYARMVVPPGAVEAKVALTFSMDGMGARLHPTETLETGIDFVTVKFFVQSFS